VTRGLAILAAVTPVGVAACGDGPPTELVCEAPATNAAPRSQCGPTLELTPINAYAGDFAAVHAREDAVVLVNGCTGTWIAAAAGPVVLTAGHCVGLGDRVLVAFNHEADADGDTLVTEGTVVERADEPDYALVALDAAPAVTPTPLAAGGSERLAIVQHARGGPKAVAEGSLAGVCEAILSYVDLDTLVGASGAGVLDVDGRVVAVHTDGNCAVDGSGVNYSWTAESIVAASPYLEDADLARAGPQPEVAPGDGRR
jgi:hypothetical protein